MSRFKTDEDRIRYYATYDKFVTTVWPVDREELDLPTTFGSTHVGRSGTADGDPLVLIHPTSGSSLGWHALIEPLAKRHTVYTPDTIGTIGRSVQTVPIETPNDLVQWLDEVLDGLGLGRVHLLGYSEGGWIAALHAALTDRPERLTSLTLVEPAGAIEQVPARTLASMIFRAGRTLTAKDKPEAIQDFNRWMNGDVELSDDDIELVQLAFGTFKQKLPKPKRLSDEQLSRITPPTLLLLASNTRIYDPAKVAQRANKVLPDVQVETIQDAGHGLPFQYPDLVTSQVLDFIESHTATPQ